ncbi:3-dehydroquinate synthase [uncultured Desulfobulbus sp.]|uniref:3-dehydroquinate synthase n=1 Tax=uncultured Desulfobulbus sp. TaxID=239745 RepID=UPI0029C97727|nr:3-dehydroquinate synthase [uncultured Desulfobulbus sp.]
MKTITIDLDERSYNIHIGTGALDNAGSIIAEVCNGKKAAVVTNTAIGKLYAERLTGGLENAGITSNVISVPAGERFKTLKTVARIYEKFLDEKIDRSCMAVGLGGGIVGDMTGFAAATWLRGIDFIQVPTSLLAQVDASVGGKTGVNLSRGKNLAGAFHQPKAVIIDVSVLNTLPPREFRSGLAEVVKHGIIRDRNYFEYIENNLNSVMSLDPVALEHIVSVSCMIKADVVRQDERESGLRRILNYGHTVAHAVERLTGYRRYKHGEAVAIGMVTASCAADIIYGSSTGMTDRIVNLLKAIGLPYRCPPDVSHDDILAAMGLDKKVSNGKLNAVISVEIGTAYVDDSISQNQWLAALDRQSQL